ncbi:MAG: glycosyltransferase, partial [Alphaproteobacteria bacterium]
MPRIGIDARKIADGGIGRYVREILGRLPATIPEAEVVAAVGPGGGTTLRRIAPSVRGIPVSSRGYSLREHVELAAVFARARCDLVHMPHYVVPALLRVPRLVVTVHDLIHCKHPRSALHALYGRTMLRVVRERADLVLVPSRAVADDLVNLAGFDPGRIEVVFNGVPEVFLEGPPVSRQAVAAFERLHGLAAPWVLNVTNGLPHKGLDVLLAALQGVSGLGLAVAGRGSGRP